MASEAHVCVIISEQKLPQELILIMQISNDTNLSREENGPTPNEFIDFADSRLFHPKTAKPLLTET